MTAQPTKPHLRKSLRQDRLALSAEERHEKSETISSRLLEAIAWLKVRNLHCFEPIMRLGEVDLVDFVHALEAGEMDTHIYTSRKIDGEWQVVSTETDKMPAAVPKFDVIIVPMLGFDPRTLHRVGWGGGYYDKFLASQPSARKIGVCYELGKVEQIPFESHDIPLDMIITEDRTYTP